MANTTDSPADVPADQTGNQQPAAGDNNVESKNPEPVPAEQDGNQPQPAADNNVESRSPTPVNENAPGSTGATKTETVEDNTPWVTGRRTDPNAYLEIYNKNQTLIGPNKNRLLPGWVLTMPATPDCPNGGTYTVVYGDTLTWIAQGRGKGTYSQQKQVEVPADPPPPDPPPTPPEPPTPAPVKEKVIKQATFQARYKQPGNEDWRVRLSLGPGSQYLYNAPYPGILAPLSATSGTDGIVFPYTPTITTTYSANYEQYDLIHSNYRGLFYKSSRVGDIQLRGVFSAQNTTEANYLLAVIHFLRSVTKMFYGQDAERGTPPPICLLNGFGGYQFSDHPVVVSAFNYTLPNDVDYIRTTNPNNFGLNMSNRWNPSSGNTSGGSLAGLYRLYNSVTGGTPKGAEPEDPSANTVPGSVRNTVPSSYVPTKMEIDLTLIPVQSRSQVSQQFSLKGFANGTLLNKGYW